MNERILSPQLLKLAQAAGPGHSQADPDWVKKFAELIIKECTNMLPEDSIRKDGVHMYYIIREHFGVSLFRGDGE